MDDTRRFLQSMNLPGRDLHHLPDSATCFRDGALYRVEIPGVESTAALDAVVETARDLDLTIHRVTALGGVALLSDREIREMADRGTGQRIEVCLAVGPRHADNGGGRIAGVDELAYAVEDVRRAVALGIRSVQVADDGLLWVLREMKTNGALPEDLALRAASCLGASNPASIWLLEELGAGSYALPPRLTLPRIAAARAAVDMPLEVTIDAEATRNPVGIHDVPEIVRVAAPVYLSYDVRPPAGTAATGRHMSETMVGLCRERVRRARLGQNVVERYTPAVTASGHGAEGVAAPIYLAS